MVTKRMKPDYCPCSCHKSTKEQSGLTIKYHYWPCCTTCPRCDKNIKPGMEEFHGIRCDMKINKKSPK